MYQLERGHVDDLGATPLFSFLLPSFLPSSPLSSLPRSIRILSNWAYWVWARRRGQIYTAHESQALAWCVSNKLYA
jgi:hypothetical protein